LLAAVFYPDEWPGQEVVFGLSLLVAITVTSAQLGYRTWAAFREGPAERRRDPEG
jgi:hypothetical protein